MGHVSDINDRIKVWFRLAEYNFKKQMTKECD